MTTPIDWPSLPPSSELPALPLERLQHYEELVHPEEGHGAIELPAGLREWVAARVPAESVEEVVSSLQGSVYGARYDYANRVRKASERAEKASLPEGYSLRMLTLTHRFDWAYDRGLFSVEQTEALAPHVEEMGDRARDLREGDIPQRHPRWRRYLEESAKVLGQTPSTLLDALDPKRLQAYLAQKLVELGPFAPSAEEIERTRIQTSSWGNDATERSALRLLRDEYTRHNAFLSDWLTEVEASLRAKPTVTGPGR